MVPKIERLDDIQRFGIGEGPHWEPTQQVLYLVDLNSGNIACYDPKTNKTIYQKVGAHASFIIPVKGSPDEFIVGSKLDLLHVKWDVKRNKILKNDVFLRLNEPTLNQINDAKCDAKGRLWFGTWNGQIDQPGGPDSSFYSFTKKGGLVKHESQIFISNGIGFSPDNRKMYFMDTLKYRVDQYDVDLDRGTRVFDKTVIDFKKAGLAGAPDGMTVDSQGKLWVACVFGSRLIQVDPTSGAILQKIEFPKCTQITSVTFGGATWDDMYVTSANLPDFPDFPGTTGAPEAGATYRVTGHGATGVKPFEFDTSL